MALLLKKEDLISSAKPTVSSTSSSSTFDKVLDLLANPTIQQIVLRIFNRVLPEEKPVQTVQAVQSNPNPEKPKLDSEKIFLMIQGFLSSLPKETTVEQLLKELEGNKEKLKGVLDAYISQL